MRIYFRSYVTYKILKYMPLMELQISRKGLQNTTAKNVRKIEMGIPFQGWFQKRRGSKLWRLGGKSVNSPLNRAECRNFSFLYGRNMANSVGENTVGIKMHFWSQKSKLSLTGWKVSSCGIWWISPCYRPVSPCYLLKASN